METELCRHHKLPKENGNFCAKCKKDLDKTSKALNSFFNSPKVVEAINEVLESN